MTDHRSMALAAAVALTLGSLGGAAFAQSASPADTTADKSATESAADSDRAVTGTLPDDSLVERRKGTLSGDPVKQGDGNEDVGEAAAPTGDLPDDSLAEKREGAIGDSVIQGGGDTDRKE